MAAFATFAAAEARAVAKVLDKTWIYAHAQQDNGTYGVRVIRKMVAGQAYGGWQIITDDATT
jgi:hypothetical protein